ncbi:hypothetical protein DVA86_13310 [Streptomyces armeniacus]|uniref:Uncharacterized protein n=1 Tax=Streptomyces armeniacus TaxID=83291 RepID=A0A345XPB8_9ACTN|nr:hypothetical protein [Streptomyces armeniacus]AXK33484.1 hypothetical protein DVA86_13310 [Streptomyces armeniacus]
MFKAWREEYRANQAMKRQIKLDEWEQEKRWREEDRTARQKAIMENTTALATHNENLKAAAGVSYLTLVCHEDTWTFMATRAFGQWQPAWTQSTYGGPLYVRYAPNSAEVRAFAVDPNLPDGRIKKISDGKVRHGMQEVILSGHNLTQLLGALHDEADEDNVADSARCGRLYNKLAEFVDLIDPDAVAGQTTGVKFRIDDSVDAAHVQ